MRILITTYLLICTTLVIADTVTQTITKDAPKVAAITTTTVNVKKVRILDLKVDLAFLQAELAQLQNAKQDIKKQIDAKQAQIMAKQKQITDAIAAGVKE